MSSGERCQSIDDAQKGNKLRSHASVVPVKLDKWHVSEIKAMAAAYQRRKRERRERGGEKKRERKLSG